jgi:hypothetical protein
MPEVNNAPRDDNRVTAMLFTGSDGLTYPLKGNQATGKITVSGVAPTKTTDTSTIISLANFMGNVCNMASANATTTYTLIGSVDFGNATILINAASQPTVTGATLIKGSDFIISTNMYLKVWNNGTRVEYWFEQIAI